MPPDNFYLAIAYYFIGWAVGLTKIELYKTQKPMIPTLLTRAIQSDTSNLGVEDVYEPIYHNERKAYAYLSMAAYCSHFRDLKLWNCGYFCDHSPNDTRVLHVFKNNSNGLGAFIALLEDKKEIVAVWEGSLDLEDWLVTNLRLKLVPVDLPKGAYPALKMHQGFLSAYQSVQPCYEASLKRLIEQFPDYKVVFTGHSLGGAMAVVSSLILIEKWNLPPSRVQVITFGQPRVGNQEISRFFIERNIDVTRYVNNKDIIAHVPTPAQGYVHHPTEQFIQGKHVTSCQSDNGEDPHCSLSTTHLSILDHAHYLGVSWNPLRCF